MIDQHAKFLSRVVQQRMGDIGIVLDITIKLRRESYRLLQLLPDELRQLLRFSEVGLHTSPAILAPVA